MQLNAVYIFISWLNKSYWFTVNNHLAYWKLSDIFNSIIFKFPTDDF